MSSETHDRLKKVIDGLKESTARDETITPSAEANLFTDLAFVYNSDDAETTQEALGVVIEQYDNLTQHKQFIQFKRLTVVYGRNMYNKFFVPIWAVAMSADKSVGYVLSPKLTPLREVLTDLKESYQTSDAYYDKLNQVLRLCFAPIALAIDALHTPIFNKRLMYHHRDICVDNIYMRARKSIDSIGQENVEYDDARLKPTKITAEALPNVVDISLPSKSLFEEYYHHADVKSEVKADHHADVKSEVKSDHHADVKSEVKSDHHADVKSEVKLYHHADMKYGGEHYDRKHDWYSFGVYILEVFYLTLPIKPETSFYQSQDYTDVSHVDTWIASSLELDAIRPFLSQYLDIAVKCLKLEPNEHQPLSYEMPDAMKQRFLEPSQTFQMYLEYSVSMWTAQLLWMYEESRPPETPGGREDEVCQACLLHSTERISTKQHGRSNQPKCDENCQYHCLLCYTNEERLFCSRQHGTTGTIVDHRYSFALILYGQSFEHVCRKDTESGGNNPFKEEADMLARALKSKHICGLSKANIHVRPVYGDGTAEDCLKRHCEEMRELVHGDGNSSCSNDTSYTLFTFYFGHSYHGRDKTVGDWCPSFTDTSDDRLQPLRLKRALVHYHMTSIQKCTNYGTSHPECQAACLGLNYLVNPCGPSPGSPAHQWSADKDVSISERFQPLVVAGVATCDVTGWFCQMLQGLYHSDCSGKPCLEDIQKRANSQTKCKVPLGKVNVCFKLARYIYEELGNAFIDGECLRIHQKHLKTHNGYTELMVQIDDEYCKPVLAYYKPQGVFLKVFSVDEGEEQVRIDMGSEVTCEKIKKTVFSQIKDREQYSDKPLDIVLSSSDQVKYPAVSDDNIHDIVESSALFYQATPSDDLLVSYAASWRMSHETHDRLKKVIDGLKESTARVETITPSAQANLFTDLAFVYNSDDAETTQEALGVVIERYDDLTQHKQFIQFKRLTAVYERNMFNKFLVPIWAVAMNADKSVGYVLSPKITPLREVLTDLKESYQTSDVYYDKLNQVLRLCFAPIALAIDALHTPIFNKRMMYHHRGICIDNIYMRVRKGIDSSGQENVEYDDAKLKLTKLTREVLPSTPLLTEYYHHADVQYSREPYDREHDWYSFGVYILEVLHITLPVTTETSFYEIEDYTDVSHVVSWITSSLEVDAIHPFLSQYLDIAVKCLKLEPNEHQPLSYEMPDEMKQRFLEPSQTFQMHFEYSVSIWTAQLLWMYEESRPTETPVGREDEVCQACFLRSTERISTKQHGRGNQPKCDENCQYHCLLCYTNEERLYCSRQHGTTGTIVDHRYSYALILYGQSFEDVWKKDTESVGINPFKMEADMLARALKSKYICGLSKANIHVRPVYGGGTPEDCLKRHCEEMRELIHGDGNSSCSNDTSYTFFTFYFGHSYHGCDKTVGDWCPSFTHTSDDTCEPLRLNRALVHCHMTSIQKCTNYGTSQPECQAACLCLNYLVNPCGPAPGSTAHQWSADKDVSISERSHPLVESTAGPCDVTVWFCQMLQGLYHSQCSGKPHVEDIQKQESYHHKCKVPLGKINACFKLARYIYEELGEAFIDGECLRIHQKHLKAHNGYTELMVHIDDEYHKPVLVYYKPQGAFWKVFSANEGEEPVNIDFSGDITCDQIKEAVLNQIKDREKYKDKTLGIVLRSSNHIEHPRVSDDNINNIVESSALFYHCSFLELSVTVTVLLDSTELMALLPTNTEANSIL